MKRSIIPLLLFLLFSCKKDRPKETTEINNANYDKAIHFRNNDIPDSSFIYFNKAKDEFLKLNDSIKIAKCLINMAIISGDQGDYFGSQEISLSAIGYLNPQDEDQREILSSNYNNLGKMASRLKRPDNANIFLSKAIDLTTDKNSKIIYLNNLAINLSDQGKHDKALRYFNQLISYKEVVDKPTTYARIVSNAAKTKWLKNPRYDPVPEFKKALEIRIREKDFWGQNASFSHLADYYETKRLDSALFYARQMYKVAQSIQSANDRLEALKKLIKLSPLNETKYYFDRYQKLDDSVQTARNAAKNQFALIRYESEKNKADNLELQKDNNEKQYQLATRGLLLWGALILLIAGSIIAVLWYKKRKQKMESEAQNAIQNSQLKTSKKVHDVVANGLYRVMTEIENQDDIDKDHILDKIEDLYEKSRDISYEKPELADQNFHEKISALLKSFATESIKILIAGNTADLWEKVNPTIRYEIEHILQELMVNMKKHSEASDVVVKFEYRQDQINIYYTDNGIGMSEEVRFKNGLRNTGNRIDGIRGEITFDTKVEKGLKIQISFPIS